MAKEIVDVIQEMHALGKPFAVATVVETTGSVSAETASKAVIDDTGRVAECLCLIGDLIGLKVVVNDPGVEWDKFPHAARLSSGAGAAQRSPGHRATWKRSRPCAATRRDAIVFCCHGRRCPMRLPRFDRFKMRYVEPAFVVQIAVSGDFHQ